LPTAEEFDRDLNASLKANDVNAVCTLLQQIVTAQIDGIPVSTFRSIIESSHNSGACKLSLVALLGMALKRNDAMAAIIDYMRFETPDKTRVEAVVLMANSAPDTRALRLFLKIPSDLFYELLVDPVASLKKAAIGMIKQIAAKRPERVPSGALSMAILREHNPTVREDMLRIARAANDPKKQKGTVIIDAAYLLNWLRLNYKFTSNSFQEATIEVKKNWLGIFQKDDQINGLIADSCILDAFLFMTQKRYRGHQIHQFNVASFGFFLLKTYVSDHETLTEYIVRTKKMSQKDVERAWMMSALLHDHAIPLVYLFQTKKVIRDLIKSDDTYKASLDLMLKTFEGAYDRIFSTKLRSIYIEDSEQTQISKLSELIKDELKRINCPLTFDSAMLSDHGVLAAVNLTTRLRGLNDAFVDSDEAIKAAANAIAMHDSTASNNSKVKVRLDKDPIAFLLILCDEAQEWGREVGGRVVGFQQRPTIECPSIQIGQFSYSNSGRFFDDDFVVKFCFVDKKTLDSTRWSADLYYKSKETAFERLDEPKDDIRPKKVTYHKEEAPKRSPS
jgi:hypothetical protein